MPLQVNIRRLERAEAHLEGELPAEELDLQNRDELVRPRGPLRYNLTVQRLGNALLARGRLELTLDCECSRCLKPYQQRLELENWAAHLPLDGPEMVPLKDDVADLTPFVREDILLELPQHPLCGADCAGPPNRVKTKTKGAIQIGNPSAWAELNKLKF